MKDVQLCALAPEQWESYVATSAETTLFHTPDWLQLLVQVYGCTLHRCGIRRGGELIGVLPLLARRLGPFYLAGSPLMQMIAGTPWLGPLCPSEALPGVLAALNGYLRQLGADYIELAFPTLLDADTCRQQRYTTETCATVVVPLAGRTEANAWRALAGSQRRAVRKAEANGLTVVEARSADFLPVYWRMCQEVYKEAGRLPHLSYAFYAAAWERLAPSGTLRAWLVQQDEQILAGGMFLFDRGSIYYLSGASWNAGLRLRHNNLLQWHVIRHGLAHGYEQYDLGGASVASITRFKLGLGGELRSYTRCHRANTWLARWGRQSYAWALPWWRRLQSQLAKPS